LEKIPTWQYRLTLFAMLCILTSEVLAGFDRPSEIVVGCGAAGVAAWCAVALWRQRRGRQADKT
jgi:hypothetical protein